MRILTTVCVALAMTFAAGSAIANNGMAGCGLGSMIFDGNSTGTQILAATTNGTFGNQTFGITSGTSNCTSGGVVKANKEQEAFVEANFESLQRDMAAGEGEFLSAFAGLLGCTEGAHATLGSFAQSNYDTLVSEGSSAHAMLSGMKTGMSHHPVLSQSCTQI